MTITLNKPGWNCSINMLAAGGAVSVNKHTKDLRAEIHPNIRYGTKKKNQKKKNQYFQTETVPTFINPTVDLARTQPLSAAPFKPLST